MIKILICDDQDIVCEGLQKIIESEPDLKVVGMANNGEEAIELAKKHLPDLVLMDLKMPVMNGIQATRILHELFPQMQILILTTYTDDDWLFDTIRNGASGYLLKDRPRDELVKAIKGTVKGDAYIDPSVTRKLLTNMAQVLPKKKQTQKISVTPREQEIIELLVMGLSNGEIAARLYLSEGTVRNYLSDLYTKLEVSDRTQAVVAALGYGLVEINKII